MTEPDKEGIPELEDDEQDIANVEGMDDEAWEEDVEDEESSSQR